MYQKSGSEGSSRNPARVSDEERENGKAMPSLSAPGREKDQRGGEKVAAEEYPKKAGS